MIFPSMTARGEGYLVKPETVEKTEGVFVAESGCFVWRNSVGVLGGPG